MIRAAITLKLCSFEETGAIVAAMTTSIPEAPASGRNWDYRFCWLRDAYFVVQALNRLGDIETMEDYLAYITNIVGASERRLPAAGLRHRPGSQADRAAGRRPAPAIAASGRCASATRPTSTHQHDVYGSVMLAATQAFFDQRLRRPAGVAQLPPAGAARRAGLRGPRPARRRACGSSAPAREVHTYSSVMCWAACDRLARIAQRSSGWPTGRRTGDAAPIASARPILRARLEPRSSTASSATLRRRGDSTPACC